MDEKRKSEVLASFSRSKMMQLFGGELVDIRPGFIELSVAGQDFMMRPAGMFNGSVIASLVDVSSGYAAAAAQPEDSYFTTVELKVNYLNAATGNKLVARAEVIKNGKTLVIIRADVFAVNQEGREIHAATSLVTMMKLKRS